MTTEERLINLESTIAFQERTIGDLSDVVCQQQKDLDLLKTRMRAILDQIAKDKDAALPADELPTFDNPPNY